MIKPKQATEYVYPLKIDGELVAKLKKKAKTNHRTIRGELTIAIENHLKNDKA